MPRKRHFWMVEPTPDDEAVMADLHRLTGVVARVEIVRLALRWLRDHIQLHGWHQPAGAAIDGAPGANGGASAADDSTTP